MTQQAELHTLAVKVGEISGQLRELKVLPNPSVADAIGVGRRNAELPTKLCATEGGLSNLQNLFVRQPSAFRCLASGRTGAPLVGCVSIIGGLRSPKEVGRVATWRIIAPMQRAMPFVRAFRPGKGERHVRSFDYPLGGQAEVSVSSRPTIRQPRPAVVRAASAINLIPKASLRAFRYIVYGEHSHGALLSHSGQGRAALQRCTGPHFLAESRYVRNCGGAL